MWIHPERGSHRLIGRLVLDVFPTFNATQGISALAVFGPALGTFQNSNSGTIEE